MGPGDVEGDEVMMFCPMYCTCTCHTGKAFQQNKYDEQIQQLLLQKDEAQKKADGYLAIIGALRGAILTDPDAKVCNEVRVALVLDADMALDLQRVRREVTEAAKALDQTYVDWKALGLAGLRMQEALTALAATELARTEKGLPLEAGNTKRAEEPPITK